MHNATILAEFEDTSCDSVYMNTASMVKSWTGLAVGLLVDRGYVENENREVCEFLPEWKSGCRHGVTIRHLLTMSSGLEKIRPASASILAQDDMNAFALRQKNTSEPGSSFSYSNEGVQLLGLLIERASGMRAGDFFQKYLFEPLQMDSTSLYVDRSGNDIVYGGAKTTVEDASRIGQLMLNEGIFRGERVISRDWIKKSTTPSAAADNYGYLWWLSPTHQQTNMANYAAMGDFGQMTLVLPEKELVYVRQQSCNNSDHSKNLYWMGLEFIEMVGNIITH